MPSKKIKKGEVAGSDLAYADSAEHIGDELLRLDLLLEVAEGSFEPYRNGSSSSRVAINPAGADSAPTREDRIARLIAELQIKEESIAERVRKSSPGELPLLRLQTIFDLSPLDYLILLICIAPAIDSRYGSIYAGLSPVHGKPAASPGFIARLLGPLGVGVASVRRSCSAHAPLFRHRLLEFSGADAAFHLLESVIVADDRIVDFILGDDYIDSASAGYLFSVHAAADQDTVARETLGALRLDLIADRIRENDPETVLIFLSGSVGAPFFQVARALGRSAGRTLLRLDCRRMLRLAPDPRLALGRAMREAILFQSALYLEDFSGEDCRQQQLPEFFLETAARLPGVYFISGDAATASERPHDFERFRRITLTLATPNFDGRGRLWRHYLNDRQLAAEAASIDRVASAFRFNADQIEGALLHARDVQFFSGNTDVPDGDATRLSNEALFAGCRAVSNRALSELAVRLPAKFTYDDIVLPPDSKQQLFDIENHVRQAETVYSDWGFEGRILSGRGLNVLFSGVSGTGKTMAASILAGQLQLELFRVDLSTVVSKYIGETEKNLGRIFQEAETSNAILFFDEADALFGKRSEVKDSHDRNANIEVGYLLQRMEEYSGMSILASNLRENMDDAFLRRLHYIVEFPFPGRTERTLIWDTAIPAAAPRGEDLSLEFLGERIKLAGGGIKNVALGAAFLAAREKSAISMRHVLAAARREYEKDGRSLLPSDLGEYGSVLAGAAH